MQDIIDFLEEENLRNSDLLDENFDDIENDCE